jgi:hypothetical protein
MPRLPDADLIASNSDTSETSSVVLNKLQRTLRRLLTGAMRAAHDLRLVREFPVADNPHQKSQPYADVNP